MFFGFNLKNWRQAMVMMATGRGFSPEDKARLARANEVYKEAFDAREATQEESSPSCPDKKAYDTLMELAREASEAVVQEQIANLARRCSSGSEEAAQALEIYMNPTQARITASEEDYLRNQPPEAYAIDHPGSG